MSSTAPYVAPPPRCVFNPEHSGTRTPSLSSSFLLTWALGCVLLLLLSRPPAAAEEKVAELREELSGGAAELDSLADDQSPEYRACGEPKFSAPQPRR